jgi:hypothetical protein
MSNMFDLFPVFRLLNRPNLGVKRTDREADHSPTNNVEVNDTYLHFHFPIYLHSTVLT